MKNIFKNISVFILLAIAFVLLSSLFFGEIVNAQTTDITLENPLTSVGDGGGAGEISKLVGLIIKALLGFIGAVVLLFFVIGSFTWLTSGGNPEKVSEGTKTMIFAAVGALVVFLSYLLTQLVIQIITT